MVLVFYSDFLNHQLIISSPSPPYYKVQTVLYHRAIDGVYIYQLREVGFELQPQDLELDALTTAEKHQTHCKVNAYSDGVIQIKVRQPNLSNSDA